MQNMFCADFEKKRSKVVFFWFENCIFALAMIFIVQLDSCRAAFY